MQGVLCRVPGAVLLYHVTSHQRAVRSAFVEPAAIQRDHVTTDCRVRVSISMSVYLMHTRLSAIVSISRQALLQQVSVILKIITRAIGDHS
jgi:hypothetical protein